MILASTEPKITEVSDAALGRMRMKLDPTIPEQKIKLGEIKSELSRRRTEATKATQSTKEAETKARESVTATKAPLAGTERSQDVSKTSKSAFTGFVNTVAGHVKMVNERAELVNKGDLSVAEKARVEEITGKLPEHLKDRMTPINKKQNRGKFKNLKTADDIRNWMVEVMKADRETVDGIEDDVIIELKDKLEPFMGLEGLNFTKKYISELNKGEQESISGKMTATDAKQKKIDLVNSIISGTAVYDKTNPDMKHLVDTGVVQIIDGKMYDSYAKESSKKPSTNVNEVEKELDDIDLGAVGKGDTGLTKLEAIHRKLTISSKDTSGQELDETKAIKKNIDFHAEANTSSDTIDAISSGDESSTVDRDVRAKGFLADIVRLFDSGPVPSRKVDSFKLISSLINDVLNGKALATRSFVRSLAQGMSVMDISKMNFEGAKRWAETFSQIEDYIDSNYGAKGNYKNSFNDIKAAYDTGEIDQSEYDVLKSFAEQAG